jgi:hypothetical protein
MDEGTDTALWIQAQANVGFAHFLLGDLDSALAAMEGTVSAVSDPTGPEAAMVYMHLARFYMLKGDPARTEENVERGMPAAERSRDVALIADGLITRGTGAAVAGRTLEADAIMDGALRLAEASGLVQPQMRALNNLSENQLRMDPRLAYQNAIRGYEIAHRFGDRTFEGGHLATAIVAAAHLGNWDWYRTIMPDISADEVEEMGTILLPAISIMEAFFGDLDEAKRVLAGFEASVEGSTNMQDDMEVSGTHSVIALLEGRYEDVARMAADLRERDRRLGAAYDLILVPFGIAERAALWSGDRDGAERELAIRRTATVQNAWNDCRMRTLEAGIAALDGRKEAQRLYEEALSGWDMLGIPLARAFCLLDLALLLGGAQAEPAAREAEAFFRAAGTERIVEQLRPRLASR